MFNLIVKIAIVIVLYLLLGGIIFNLFASFFDILATITRFLGRIVDWFGVTPVLSDLISITPLNL